MPETRPACWQILIAVIALALAVGAVFFPMLRFEFVDLDVPSQVIENPYIHSLDGESLKHILSTRGSGGSTSSYYPIRTLTYAVDCQLWGLDAGGFKLTNGLLHLVNVLLVLALILRLLRHGAAGNQAPQTRWELSVATFSAGIFAVHPVVVEPVAWVAGREELLMTLGALGCFHFHLAARRRSEHGGSKPGAAACYAAAAFCCGFACLSNAVAAVIPLLVTAWDVLMLARPRLWKVVSGTALLWLIGGATVGVKLQGDTSDPALERAATLSAAIQELGYFDGTVVDDEGTLSATIERFARLRGPGATEPGPFSTGRLALVLHVYWLNLKTLVWPTQLALVHSQVATEGLADAGVILGAIAAGVTGLVLWKLRRRKLILFGLIWLGLALAPASQIMPHHIHRADRFLYLPLVGLTMIIAMGLRPLRNALTERAVAGVTVAGVLTLLLLATLSAGQLQTWRNSLSVWDNCVRVSPDSAFAHRGLAENLALCGQVSQAAEHCRIAVQLDPTPLEKMNDFVLELAACDEEGLRDYELALRLSRQACQLTEWKDPRYLRTLAVVHGNLAESLSDRRQAEEALENYRIAIQLARAAGDAELAKELQAQLERDGKRNPGRLPRD